MGAWSKNSLKCLASRVAEEMRSLKSGPEAGQILNKAKQDVCMKRALMGFVDHHHTAGRSQGTCVA